MKKSTYINKYDFVNYYTKQPSLWFFSNDEINAAISTELHISHLEADEDDLDEASEDLEFDSYEYYKSQLSDNQDCDKDNPYIQEGIIIDNKSREFIINSYKHIDKVVDLEKEFINQYDQKKLSEQTKALILQYDKIILFQPVFINGNLITKPDAIVKDGDLITLIETKGTTTAKLYHALDIYFQAKVLLNLDYLKDFGITFQLCLIAYDYADKYDVKFILTEFVNYTKSVAMPSSSKKKSLTVNQKQLIKIGQKPTSNGEGEYAFLSLDCICNDSVEDLYDRLEIETHPTAKASIEKAITLFLKVFNEFDRVIETLQQKLNELQNIENIQCKNILPHPNDKNPFKVNELFPVLRKLYSAKGYELFTYTGTMVNMGADALTDLEKRIDIRKYAKQSRYDIVDLIDTMNQPFIVNMEHTRNLFNNIKSKKVYFDFETINTSIRAIDHILPFMQIVTQCSIIIDDLSQSDVSLYGCNNILIDPKLIKIDDFKDVVDALYRGPDFSYIVYNKNFERSRLNEFKTFINDDSYTSKIDVIINNMFDLADFFTFKKELQTIPIIIKELGGFYSIKKVLPFIQKHYPDIYHQVGCLDYNDLVIYNGLCCQNKTTMHFLNPKPDYDVWNELADNMKKYCENDVRAMIAIEQFIKQVALKSDR